MPKTPAKRKRKPAQKTATSKRTKRQAPPPEVVRPHSAFPDEERVEFITVRVGKLPGGLIDIALNGGRTVKDAFDGAELDPGKYQIRVNGLPADLRHELKEGDTVLLLNKIRGNC